MQKYYFKILMCLILLCESMHATQEKCEKWEKITREVELVEHALGCPVDARIKNLVIALNAIGISTIQSCEGHLNHGFAYPWVDINIQSDSVDKLITKAMEMVKKREEEQILLMNTFPKYS